MEFRSLRNDDISLAAYTALFRTCFPKATHLSVNYLRWLYANNPAGYAVGFDAYEGDRLAGHYACVPARMVLDGEHTNALLSLNTAVHPDFQGKFLFTKLAKMTYEYAASSQFDFIYGVANAYSTPGFVKRLGFQLIRPLESTVGLGQFNIQDWDELFKKSTIHRSWGEDAIRWRMNNPANQVQSFRINESTIGMHCPTGKLGIRAYAELPAPLFRDIVIKSHPIKPWVPRLFLGLLPKGTPHTRFYLNIPERMRPSLLNLIYLNLRQGGHAIDTAAVFFNFLDFDAY